MRKTYQVHLIVDDEVVDTSETDNCRTAIRGTYERLDGMPSAEATIRADGKLLCFMRTNWRGEMWEIEFYTPSRQHNGYIHTHFLNPLWGRWPGKDTADVG